MRMPFAAIGLAVAVWLVNVCSHAETARSLPVGIKRHLRSDKLTQANEEERSAINEVIKCVIQIRGQLEHEKVQFVHHQTETASKRFWDLGLQNAPKTNVLLFLTRLARDQYVKHLDGVSPRSESTLATVLRQKFSHRILKKVATWLSKSPQELEWLQQQKPPERVFEDLKRGGEDPFLHPDISKWTDYVEVYYDLHPKSMKPLMTLMEYKEDELIEKVALGLGTDMVHDSLRKRVANELFQTWTYEKGEPISPADAYSRLGLKTEKEVKFTSPKFTVWLYYVAFFNTGKEAKDTVSFVSVLWSMFDLLDVVDQLIKTDAGSVNMARDIAKVFRFCLVEEMKINRVYSIVDLNERVISLSKWKASTPRNRKRRREV